MKISMIRQTGKDLDPLRWKTVFNKFCFCKLCQHHKGINMVFVDGHEARLRPRELWILYWDSDGDWQDEYNRLPVEQRGP